MNKKILLLLPLLSLGISNTYAQNGVYFSLEGGVATQTGLPTTSEANAQSLDTQYAPNAIRGSVGYNHDFNSVYGLGFEGGVGQYGKSTYGYADGSNTIVKSHVVDFLTTHTFHMQQFDLLAKLGGVRITPKVSGTGAAHQDTKICPEAGIGGIYNVNSHFALTANYSHVFGAQINTISGIGSKTPSVNEALLGIRYTFHD